jgi:hypothetical protein
MNRGRWQFPNWFRIFHTNLQMLDKKLHYGAQFNPLFLWYSLSCLDKGILNATPLVPSKTFITPRRLLTGIYSSVITELMLLYLSRSSNNQELSGIHILDSTGITPRQQI